LPQNPKEISASDEERKKLDEISDEERKKSDEM
jgi:hypothetical protein